MQKGSMKDMLQQLNYSFSTSSSLLTAFPPPFSLLLLLPFHCFSFSILADHLSYPFSSLLLLLPPCCLSFLSLLTAPSPSSLLILLPLLPLHCFSSPSPYSFFLLTVHSVLVEL